MTNKSDWDWFNQDPDHLFGKEAGVVVVTGLAVTMVGPVSHTSFACDLSFRPQLPVPEPTRLEALLEQAWQEQPRIYLYFQDEGPDWLLFDLRAQESGRRAAERRHWPSLRQSAKLPPGKSGR